jgi:hypothetical protein
MWCGRPLASSPPQQSAPAYPQQYQPPPQYQPQYPPAQVQAPKKRSPLLIFALLALCLCAGVGGISLYGYLSSPSPDSGKPPEYVKEVVALKEGEKAVQVYFILADEDQIMTSSDGKATLRILEDGNELYRRVENVKKSQFQVVKRGRGAFENDAVVYDFGRIPYSEFSKQPQEFSGDVVVSFVLPDGRGLEGKDTILFDR